MKKLLLRLFCIVLCLISLSTVAFAESLTSYQLLIEGTEGYDVFLGKHPTFKPVYSKAYYPNTAAIASAFLTKEFDSDLFSMSNLFFDSNQLMSKGYCLDLSGSTIISETVHKMHPSIRNQAMHEGRIYAIPDVIMFDLLMIDRNVWQEAGLPDEIPDTMEEFLSFLETWCDWLEENPYSEFRITNMWDAASYNESSYTELLTGWIINNYIMYAQYTGNPLPFDADILQPLLERAMVIGKRLYENEPHIGYNNENAGRALFVSSYSQMWPQNADDIVFLRMNEEQPKLINCCLLMTAVSINTDHPELCIELLEDMITHMSGEKRAFLMQECEPVINASVENQLNNFEARISEIDAQLATDNPNESLCTELELERTNLLAKCSSLRNSLYIMSEAQIESYQSFGNTLYIAAPSVFAAGTEDYVILINLQRQFASGTINVDKFLNELNRMAQMIQMELGE